MISLDIQITVPPELQRLPERMATESREALRAAGAAVQSRLQEHFLQRNSAPNKKNWPKRGIWGQIADAVSANDSAQAYELAIGGEAGIVFWRRYQGGAAFRAKTGPRKLAIPARAEAYAAGRPSLNQGLPPLAVMVRRKDGRMQGVALAEYTERPSKRDPDKTVKVLGSVWYWLVESANPPADPDAMPPTEALQSSATEAAAGYLRRAALRLNRGSA